MGLNQKAAEDHSSDYNTRQTKTKGKVGIVVKRQAKRSKHKSKIQSAEVPKGVGKNQGQYNKRGSKQALIDRSEKRSVSSEEAIPHKDPN